MSVLATVNTAEGVNTLFFSSTFTEVGLMTCLTAFCVFCLNKLRTSDAVSERFVT